MPNEYGTLFDPYFDMLSVYVKSLLYISFDVNNTSKGLSPIVTFSPCANSAVDAYISLSLRPFSLLIANKACGMWWLNNASINVQACIILTAAFTDSSIKVNRYESK